MNQNTLFILAALAAGWYFVTKGKASGSPGATASPGASGAIGALRTAARAAGATQAQQDAGVGYVNAGVGLFGALRGLFRSAPVGQSGVVSAENPSGYVSNYASGGAGMDVWTSNEPSFNANTDTGDAFSPDTGDGYFGSGEL